METVCPESQGLEFYDYDDNDDKFSYFYHSARRPSQWNNLGGSQGENLGEPIPFSLNTKHSEFSYFYHSPRRTKHSYMVEDKGEKNGIHAKMLAKQALELEEEAQEFQEPFYKGMEMSGSLSEDKGCNWSYYPPPRQRSHLLQTARMAPCGSHDPFQGSTEKCVGLDAFASRAHASEPYLGYPKRTMGGEPQMLHEEAIEDGESLHLTYDMLREENVMLRKMVRSMESSLENQACTVKRLEGQLKVSLAKEEREAQELQSFVQCTKWNLQLMTQRALEAESNVEKLKQEIFILQGELERSQMENKKLKAGQMTDLGAMKNNVDFALQNLEKIIMVAKWSSRQLTSGADHLCFVAEVLKSTDKISEAEAGKAF
ncbi:PREDICTED: serologically defined colon cancer antigen 3 homolog [Cariama cristata]|uniref:serologically defined colon cancer antigen 3 homolog n=1 Tax=Cariama cristata TaxID=54380 RepID=UPI00052085F9|nr:PREDICTED: serologically defined colon cancer antigen 3 homolog [Cariama cristata]